jgi:hypothetical protein
MSGRTTVSVYGPSVANSFSVITSLQQIERPRDYYIASSSAAVTFEVNFRDAAGAAILDTFDTVFLCGTNITSVTFATAANLELFSASSLNGRDFCFSFPQTQRGLLKITAAAPQGVYIKKLFICKSLFTLGSALTSYSLGDYAKEGYFYLNNGDLLKWEEYKKASCVLEVENASSALRENIKSGFQKHNTLVFSLNSPGADEVYEFALSRPPAERLNRPSRAYNLTLNMTER